MRGAEFYPSRDIGGRHVRVYGLWLFGIVDPAKPGGAMYMTLLVTTVFEYGRLNIFLPTIRSVVAAAFSHWHSSMSESEGS